MHIKNQKFIHIYKYSSSSRKNPSTTYLIFLSQNPKCEKKSIKYDVFNINSPIKCNFSISKKVPQIFSIFSDISSPQFYNLNFIGHIKYNLDKKHLLAKYTRFYPRDNCNARRFGYYLECLCVNDLQKSSIQYIQSASHDTSQRIRQLEHINLLSNQRTEISKWQNALALGIKKAKLSYTLNSDSSFIDLTIPSLANYFESKNHFGF